MICVHHWIIDGSGGGDVSGTCNLCGAERTFHNVDVSMYLNPAARHAEGALSASREYGGYGKRSRGTQN